MAKRPPALSVLALMFVTSAALRVYDSGGAVLAASEIGSDTGEMVCISETPDILAALEQRSSDLDAREAEMMDRAEALEVKSREIDAKIAEMERAKSELEATVVMVDSASENDLAQLTSVYENMKPSEAAALFALMDPTFAAGFIARMQPEISAQILASVDPQIAYSLSVVLAGRNANAGK